MTGKSSPSKNSKCGSPSKRKSSPRKSVPGKDLSTSSAPSVSETAISWDANAADSNGHVTLNLEFPSGGWEQESSDNDSSFNLEIVEDHGAASEYHKKRKRLRSEVSAEDNVILEGMEEEIERQLEAKAERNNLSVLNVKNILRQVITHPHVLAMVRRSAKDGNCTVSGDNEEFQYEPKLTRAKAKELLEKVKDVDWPVTPCKKPVVSEFEALAIQEMAEDSDDDEYQPGDETSECEFSEKDNSELDTPIEQSPAHVDTDDMINSTPCTPDSTADRSVTSYTDDGLFKIPMTPHDHQKEPSSTQEEGEIARRTRSKLSLSDTPLEEIEKAFVPPDVPPGYYDSSVNDANVDNDDWKEFLKEFMEPLPADQHATEVNDDDEADPEYNVLAEEEVVDKEELRMDRAVKVSRREVNALLAELFDYTETMSSEEDEADDAAKDATISNILYGQRQTDNTITETASNTSRSYCDRNDLELKAIETPGGNTNKIVECNISKDDNRINSANVSHENSNFTEGTAAEHKTEAKTEKDSYPPKATCQFSLSQRLLLDQQIRQHVQLLTQQVLLTYEHPLYEDSAPKFMNLLNEVRDKAEESSQYSPLRAANLPAAFEVIEQWKFIMHSEKGESIKAFMARQIEEWQLTMLKRSARLRGKLPKELMELMCESVAFTTPQLLPQAPYKCLLSKLAVYVPSEIMLIALGLEEFTQFILENSDGAKKYHYQQALQYISHYLIPSKDSDQLTACVRKEKKKLDSPIRYYYDHKTAPPTVHFVHPFNPDRMLTPKQQPFYLLPTNWRDFLYPAFES